MTLRKICSRLEPALWAALRDCKDAQLYTADINVVELGLIGDVRVRGDVVEVVMTMPHRGHSAGSPVRA